MNYEETTPATDKWLHADGSVTTLVGEMIFPADQNRAQEYASRAAAVDKWLHPDGSVTDGAGRVILEADESRALDYESRMANTVSTMMPGDNLTDSGYKIKEKTDTYLLFYAFGKETVPSGILLLVESDNAYLLPYAGSRPGEEYMEPNTYPITDAASAVLQ
jgi:hypothetical protein